MSYVLNVQVTPVQCSRSLESTLCYLTASGVCWFLCFASEVVFFSRFLTCGFDVFQLAC